MTDKDSSTPVSATEDRHAASSFADETPKHLREQLAEANNRDLMYERLLSASPDMLAYLDGGLVFRMVNDRFARAIGKKKTEIIGRTPQDIVEPDIYATFLRSGLEECLNGRTVSQEQWLIQPGSPRIRLSLTLLPHFSETGAVCGITINARDITVRTRIFESLRQSEIHYRVLARNLPGGFVGMFDRSLRIILADGTALSFFGISREEIENKLLKDAVPVELCRQIEPACQTALQGRVGSLELHWQGRIFETKVLPAHETDELAAGIIVARDITVFKSMEAELRAALADSASASKAKSAFVANMSHEIRTPVSGILGMLDVLHSMRLPAEALDCLNLIRQSADSLLAIINDILDISRIEAGKMVFADTDFDLPELIRSTSTPFVLQAENKRLRLEIDLDPGLPGVLRGDPDRLAQVLRNLLGNAIKFTQVGFVRLSAKPTATVGDTVTILFTVEDSGIGIPEDRQGQLFNFFTQADASTTKRYGGAGLGLAISRQIVRILGGEITLTSEPGVGSVFCFAIRLPLGSGISPETGSDATAAEPFSFSGRKILLAEDNKINRIYLQHFLDLAGFAVTQAEDGQQALEMFRQNKFDIILMDVQMPRMSGDQATAEIRRIEAAGGLPRTPVIALTAYAMTGDRERFLASGMDEYLAKPVDIPDLWSAINRLLGPISAKPISGESPIPRPVRPEVPAVSRNAGTGSGIDGTALRGRFGRDPKILAEALDLFMSVVPARLTDLQTALAHGDQNGCAKALHSLVNNMIAVTAKQASEQARRLEGLARRGQLDEVGREMSGFLAEIENVLSEIREFRKSV